MAILYMTQHEYERIDWSQLRVDDMVWHDDGFYSLTVHADDSSIIHALAHFLLREYEPLWLNELIAREYLFEGEEKADVLRYALYLLNDGDLANEGTAGEIAPERLIPIRTELQHYIRQADTLYLEGFFRFRLKWLWMGYAPIVENAIDEYRLEEEYYGYIHYLRGLANNRTIHIPHLHIVQMTDERYLFFDSEGKEVDVTPYLDIGQPSSYELLYDEALISQLLAINPNEIVFHHTNGGKYAAHSIRNIFEERFIECTGCRLCHDKLGIAKNT